MKVGDLVRSTISKNGCWAGIIVKIGSGKGCPIEGRGAMILWEHGEICYSPIRELEVISESR